MATAYGIDLGTTYSAIARLGVTGAPEIIADTELGKDTLASAVFFAEDGTVIVGDTAKEEGVTAPERLHQFFKRWIGRGTDPNREHYFVDGKEYDPIELSSIVLGRIINYAKDNGEEVKDVVITCPAYFDYAQRDATKQAGVAAGLNVMVVINEPTAAAINYCVNRFNEDQNVLVYDLGGGTFDVTLMRMTQNGANRSVDVLGTDGDAFLGGCDWDNELYQLLLAKYEEQYGNSADKMPEELKTSIRGQVEDLKMKLTNKEKAKTKIPYDGENVILEVTREEFESATAGYVEQTVGWLNSVLQKANMTDDDVDVVLMVGGSTKMPMIRGMLTERFGEKAFFGDPDKSVAKGAAIVADMKLKNAEVVLLKQLQEQLQDGNIRLERARNTGKVKIVSNVEPVQGEDTDIVYESESAWNPIGDLQNLEDTLSEKLGEVLSDVLEGETEIDLGAAVAVIDKQIEETDGGIIEVTDVAPRTFGLVAGRRGPGGKIELIVDNIVHKDEKVPCSYTRTYYTPEDNTTMIRLPVIESISEHDVDSVERGSVLGEFVFPDSSLDMKQRQQLVLNIPVSLPADSEIHVEFSLDEYGNVYLKATEPTSGVTNDIQFSFNEIDQSVLDQIAENQKNRTYAVDY